VKIEGVLPAALTPRAEGSTAVDFSASLDLLDFLESHHVDGIALFGSTGEFTHFSIDDRTRLVGMAAKRVRVPLVVNASHSTLEGAVQIAQEAAGAGAAAVLIMPPYYFRYGQEEIRAFCLQFAEQVDIPVYLYNMPFSTTELELQTSLDLLSTGEFAGIKDSGGKWEHFEALQALAVSRAFSVLTGAEVLYSRMKRAGVAGTISGFASVLPELIVAIDRRVRAGQDTVKLDAYLAEFAQRALGFPFPIGVKEAAAVRGIKSGPNASPLGSDQSRRLEDFRAWFRERLPEILQASQEHADLNPAEPSLSD
jgi:dihydrodipicolinate synthase/N-acetylneuraminate lyase